MVMSRNFYEQIKLNDVECEQMIFTVHEWDNTIFTVQEWEQKILRYIFFQDLTRND